MSEQLISCQELMQSMGMDPTAPIGLMGIWMTGELRLTREAYEEVKRDLGAA